MIDVLINIFICFKALAWIPARVIRFTFHLSSPKIKFSQYIQGENTKYGEADLLSVITV